jgi:glycosyltransferase involved in cell wall biosynthesis
MNRRKKYIVNCRFFFQQTTGVQRYAIECTKIINNLSDVDVDFIAHRGKINHQIKEDISIKQFGILKGHLWEQIELPIYCFFKNATLINLCGAPSIFLKKQLYAIHDLAYFEHSKFFNFIYSFFYKTLMRFSYSRIEKIITVSNFTKNEAHKILGKREISIVNNSYNHLINAKPSECHTTLKHDNFILTVGSIDPRKNLNHILKNFLDLKNDTKLVIIGTKNKVFKTFINENQIKSENIIFTGFITDELLREYYKQCLCFISASHYEGFDIPALEAVYFKKPIITSDIPVHREVLKDYPWYISPIHDFNFESAFNKAIEKMDSNALVRKEILNSYSQNNQRAQLQKIL